MVKPESRVVISPSDFAPVATRMEGLLAIIDYYRSIGEHDNAFFVEHNVRYGISFLLAAQIKEGEDKGGVPRAAACGLTAWHAACWRDACELRPRAPARADASR